MLSNTDQPKELIMLYTQKLDSLLLDSTKELYPYIAQLILDTGILDDLVLKNVLFN